MRYYFARVPSALFTALLLLGMALPACTLFPEPDYITYTSGLPGARDIAVVRPNGGHAFILTDDAQGRSSDNFEPVWDPNRQRIAFLSNRDGNVEVYVAVASEDAPIFYRITNSEFEESQVSWSADGNRIAYTSEDHEGTRTVQHVALDELVPTAVVFGSAGESDPAWSPIDNLIVFAKLNENGESEGIFLRDPSNVNIVPITAGPHHFPTWSPDGGSIAYVSTQNDGQRDIYVINVSALGPTSNPLRVTEDGADDYNPAWSRDGSRIAFISDRSGNADVYTIVPDGSGLTPITQNAVNELSVAWGPDGSLVFPSGPEDRTSPLHRRGGRRSAATHERRDGNPAGLVTSPSWGSTLSPPTTRASLPPRLPPKHGRTGSRPRGSGAIS